MAAGQGRLVVRHTAAAPAVDVLAGGTPVFRNLSNPNQASADLPAGTVSASVAATGTTQPVIGPANVPVVEGQATIVYAVGSLSGGNLGVLGADHLRAAFGTLAVAGGNSGLADVGTPTPWAAYDARELRCHGRGHRRPGAGAAAVGLTRSPARRGRHARSRPRPVGMRAERRLPRGGGAHHAHDDHVGAGNRHVHDRNRRGSHDGAPRHHACVPSACPSRRGSGTAARPAREPALGV